MISLPSYNLPLSLKQLIKNYIPGRTSAKSVNTPVTPSSTDLNHASFLIVSDDPFTSFVFGRYIEKWNGVISIASSLPQAIDHLCKNQYKAVLLDTKNPRITLSSDLLKALGNKKVNAIALVDEKSETLRNLLAQTGLVTDWLEKEIDPTELSKKLLFYTK